VEGNYIFGVDKDDGDSTFEAIFFLSFFIYFMSSVAWCNVCKFAGGLCTLLVL
jgi:hypothetical protein